MMRILGAVALAGILPFAAPALAQGIAQPPYAKGDLAAFHGDTMSLVNAIAKIEQTTGGAVLEIRFAEVAGSPGYHAVVAKGGNVEYMRLESEGGNLTPVAEHSRPVWMLNWRGKDDVRLSERATVSLAQAIQTAEQTDDNRPAIAAGLARSATNGDTMVHAYNVLIDSDGFVRRVAVDDRTGQVIADPQALAGWP